MFESILVAAHCKITVYLCSVELNYSFHMNPFFESFRSLARYPVLQNYVCPSPRKKKFTADKTYPTSLARTGDPKIFELTSYSLVLFQLSYGRDTQTNLLCASVSQFSSVSSLQLTPSYFGSPLAPRLRRIEFNKVSVTVLPKYKPL